ncbi:unnamed protein product [Schistosoma mattheei]|uniref:Uncharacterized protein n=1 Tax=Schistosoma mattheei TaxID=31246 RepID=A0A183P974_9TREM|nr:unnamed protein product [Schistosoma mattheei]
MSFSENPNSQSEQKHEEFKTLPEETLGTVEQRSILNDNSRINEVEAETEQNDLIVLDPDHLNLDNKHNEYAEYHGKYENAQNKLTTLREKYQTSVKTMLQETKKMHSMRDEVDALCLRLYYLNKAKEDVSGDLLVLQRAVEKVHTDLSKFEDEKLRQDLSVDRMQTKVDQLKDDITLYEAQIVAQEIEMNTSQNLLYEAEAQIVAINVDKAHLLTQWKTSLLGLQRRNEAYADLLAAYNKLKEELLVLENEQNAYKLSINKEQETHERLTGLQNKNESDLNTLRKQLLHSETKLEADKQAYTTYSRILLETERNLFNAKTRPLALKKEVHLTNQYCGSPNVIEFYHEENNTAQANVNNIRKQLEKKVLEKQDLEKKISEELRDRLTAQKAANYANKININVQDQSRELLTQIVQMENQIAKDELGVAHKKARNKQQQEKVSELEREIDNTNLLITKLEGEIHHANISVEHKQGNIDILNKKLERLIRDCGVSIRP